MNALRRRGDGHGRCALQALDTRRSCWISGFTLIELIVVITVIVLILALAVPGLSEMSAQARLTSAKQAVNGVMTRAYYQALADMNMTAVRFFPGQWDAADESWKGSSSDRQHMAIYSYAGTSEREDGNDLYIEYDERFQRTPDVRSVRLPRDVWVAPLEALSRDAMTLGRTTYNPFGSRFVLDGEVDRFAFNADRGNSGSDGGRFLNADDFLIVCDPQTGIQAGVPRAFKLRAFVPEMGGAWGYDAEGDGVARPYQRYSFSGVVVYRREPFAALGVDASGEERQGWLRETGRPYMAHRFSGGLMAGAQRPE